MHQKWEDDYYRNNHIDSAVHQAETIGCLTFKCTRGFLAGPGRPTHNHAGGVAIAAWPGCDVEDSGCLLCQVPLGAQPPQNVQELFLINSHEPLRVPHGLGISPQWDHPGRFRGLASLPPPPTQIRSPGTVPLMTNRAFHITRVIRTCHNGFIYGCMISSKNS